MRTILLVDDDPEQLRSLRLGLMSKGYNVIGALEGREALRNLENPQAKISLVITDFSMPGMNGIDFLKRVKERFKFMPVIMMSAYGEKTVVIEALQNQCDSFIEKPFTLDGLILEIERARHNMVRNTHSHDIERLLPRLVHQINNPLMAILAYAELSMSEIKDQEALKSKLKSIIAAAKKIREINAQILSLGLPREDKMELVDLIRIIEDSLGMFCDLITLKEVIVEKEFEGESIYVYGSSDKLEQAINNLILNAVDAMDCKSLKVLKVRVKTQVDPSSVLICMEDTGWGIPENSIHKVFNPYFTRKKGGTGIGLAVVREVVENHGGRIIVSSKIGEGTTFSVHLPLVSSSKTRDIIL